jgi:catechol 2,3-dioxygenase-like lactoylglutathione lyase family enzyme
MRPAAPPDRKDPMTDGFFPHSYFHVGLVVPDLETTAGELQRALGLTFNPPHESVYAGDRIRVAYARQGPPYYEVIEGSPGSRWDTAGGPRIDHVGYFSDDLERDVAALEAAGLPIEIDGRPQGVPFTYHRADASGIRVELISDSWYERLLGSIRGERPQRVSGAAAATGPTSSS